MSSPRITRHAPGALARTLGCAAMLAVAPAGAAAQPRATFARDVAPILFEHCAPCHRPGEIAPFSLLTYQEVRPRAAAIARAVRTREMPPWKPEPGVGDFLGARRLTDAQIDAIERWAAGGAVEGSPGDLPPPPVFPDGWRLGRPDLIVTMPEPYVVPGGGADVLRSFVIPIPVKRARFVRGIEFRPGNARVVHHANMRFDRTGTSRRHDEADAEPGFDGRLSAGAFPDGHFLGWTPGQLSPLLPPGLAWTLAPDSDLVLQLHLKAGDAEERVQSSVGLYFTDDPPARRPLMLRLGRQNIDIPAGRRDYTIEDRYVLPVDVDVHGVQPHAHYRARRIEGYAVRPDGTRTPLILITDWDFNWQDAYRYREPIRLPRGTTLAMRFTFDNSPANRRNPDRPPKRVRWGQRSTDEMGDLWIQVLPIDERDRQRLYADVGPKILEEDAVGYETLLAGDPDNARLHEAAAAIYLSLDRSDPAMRHLREALRIAPDSVEAHYNLATALARLRRSTEAIAHFERALELDPAHVAARVNLGATLRSEGRLDEAQAHLRRALELDPASPVAHTNLAGILIARRQTRDAVAHYRRALDANGALLEALTGLSWTLATSSDPDLIDPAAALRLAERAIEIDGASVRALDTLAAAQAAAGRFDDATATIRSALDMAERTGPPDTVRRLRERLELYTSGKPLREP